MKLTEITNSLNLEVYAGSNHLDREVTGGYCSDLLSDVMGNAASGNVWITLQAHNNILAVASLKELSAIIIVRGLKLAEEVIEKAESEGIPLLCTTDPAFEIAGKLYELLKR